MSEFSHLYDTLEYQEDLPYLSDKQYEFSNELLNNRDTKALIREILKDHVVLEDVKITEFRNKFGNLNVVGPSIKKKIHFVDMTTRTFYHIGKFDSLRWFVAERIGFRCVEIMPKVSFNDIYKKLKTSRPHVMIAANPYDRIKEISIMAKYYDEGETIEHHFIPTKNLLLIDAIHNAFFDKDNGKLTFDEIKFILQTMEFNIEQIGHSLVDHSRKLAFVEPYEDYRHIAFHDFDVETVFYTLMQG